MSDNDQLTESPELRELRDSLAGVAIPEPPCLEAITARGRAHRRHQLSTITRVSVAGVAVAAAAAFGLSGAFTPAGTLGTIRTAAYTLRHNASGTDTLTLNPVELLNPSQLQSDFAQYGIPAKVTTGSYCTSDPEPAGFPEAVTAPTGQGDGREGSGPQPTITIDPSQIPAGTKLSVGYFQLTSGPAAGEQQANMSLINTGSFSCSTTPPDMTKPDTSNGDLGLLYGGPGRSGS